jgi:SAM-dependent methyltransferase
MNFDSYSFYYDLLYKDKNYAKESEQIKKIIFKYNNKCQSILEIGMGSGNHASNLVSDFQIFGIEKSAKMAKIANSKGLECIVSNAIDFNLSKTFDACISLFHVISYLNQNDEIIKAFQNINNHMKFGGHFIFDTWYTPGVFNIKPSKKIKKIIDGDFEILRIAEPIEESYNNIVIVNYTIIIINKKLNFFEIIEESHSMRHFSIPEIKLFANNSGFEFIEAEQLISGNSISDSSWDATFVLKKIV